MRKLLAFVLVLALMGAVVVGCAKKEEAQPPATGQGDLHPTQVLRFNNGTEPQTIDPAKSSGIPEANIELACFEGLTRLDANNQPVPGVAKEWTVSPDGLTYTFKLRPEAKWSNGDPVTAHDFEWSWKRALAPETAAEYAYQLYYIKNGEKYNAGEIKDPNEVGVKALDDYTLEVKLEAPCGYFLSLCAFPTLLPVHRKTVEADPDKWATDPKTYIGNGPFKLAVWEHNSNMVFVPNEQYWDKGRVKLQKLVFTMIENGSTELVMYETGALDYADNPPLAELDRLRKEGQLRIEPLLGTYYYLFNVTRPPFDNPKVRKALTLAIDRKTLIEQVVKGGQLPALAFVPGGVPDAEPGSEFRKVGGDYFKDNDVETAKKLLAEAGYPDGKNFPKFTILHNTSESHKKIAEAIQEMWKKNLGIENVTITNQEWGVYLDTRTKLQYDVARAGWLGDYIDPMTFIDMWVTGGGNNDTGWGNPQYDELVKKAKSTADQKVRMQAMHEAEKILMDEMPIAPIYFYTDLFLVKDYVKGVIRSTLGFHDFSEAWIAKH